MAIFNSYVGLPEGSCMIIFGWFISALWLFNIAMENSTFIDGLPMFTYYKWWFSMTMLNNQMVDQVWLTKIYKPSFNWAGHVVSNQEPVLPSPNHVFCMNVFSFFQNMEDGVYPQVSYSQQNTRERGKPASTTMPRGYVVWNSTSRPGTSALDSS